jgi:hypothetical protein
MVGLIGAEARRKKLSEELQDPARVTELGRDSSSIMQSYEPSVEDYNQALALVEEIEQAAKNEPALKAMIYKLARLTSIVGSNLLDVIAPPEREYSRTGMGTPYIDAGEGTAFGDDFGRRLIDERKRLEDLKEKATQRAIEKGKAIEG